MENPALDAVKLIENQLPVIKRRLDDQQTDMQLLIWQANRLQRFLGLVERQHAPGGAPGEIDRFKKDRAKLCAKYNLEEEPPF